MIYLDTSAIVKLFVEEEHSEDVRQATRGHAVRTVAIAFVEALSAFARKKELSETERGQVIQEFLASWPRFRPMPTDPVLQAAGILARTHRLRGFDAIHLAAAKELGAPSKITFAVYDEELAKAASREGFHLHTAPRFGLA